LRVLQEKEVVRVGGTRPISVDIRIISATNIDLEEAVQKGKFREDLYYRLNVIPIKIPPLRERKGDIYKLTLCIVRKFNQDYGRSIQDISPGALKKLMEYDWPGNVRELENFIGRAIINMKFTQTVIKERHLPEFTSIKSDRDDSMTGRELKEKDVDSYYTLEEIVNETEKAYISKVLEQENYNKTEVAKRLGISIRSLYYKIDKNNLHA